MRALSKILQRIVNLVGNWSEVKLARRGFSRVLVADEHAAPSSK